jgi:NitT/TauT family transport system permease protein
MSKRASKAERIIIWAVWIAGIILLWELCAFLLDGVLHDPMAPSKLPYFHNVIAGLVLYAGQLASAMLVTFSRALIGLVIGAAVGFILAITMSLSKTIEDIAFPYLIISQMIPVLGWRPSSLRWCGIWTPRES